MGSRLCWAFKGPVCTRDYSATSFLPCRLLAVALVHVGGGEFWGRTTGAKALFCLTAADTMLAGEKEKMPEELLQLEGRLVDDAMVGLDGTTGRCARGGRGKLDGGQEREVEGVGEEGWEER